MNGLPMTIECQCGKGIAQGSDADLCLACQSKLTHCKIDVRKLVMEEKGFSIPVQWCTEKDCCIINADCENCEYYSQEKILPEVGEYE